MHHYIMEGDISDVAICTSLHVAETSYYVMGKKKAVHTKNSQRDDSRGEALGDSLGVHAEGAVFGAGAGRRTAGYLWGSPGV